ncbi:MAG: caspase family protein, partial [Paracoccaceae bacterium]
MAWIVRLMFAAMLALAASGAAMAEGRRLALVIGNGAYEALPPLDNAVADANSMARALRAQDFDVTLLTDVGTEVFDAVLGTFARQAEGADTVLFYYAGHAFQMNGVNHLVPVSARIDSADTARSATWKLDDIAARLKGGSAQLLIFLDACRNNPLPQSVPGAADGLAQFDGGAGTFVAFATRPGAVAYDGTTGGSPFTQALVNRIATPGQSVSDLMIAVRNDVQQATGGAQVPWEQSSLRAQFYFTPAETGTAAAPEEVPQFDVVQSASTVGPAPVSAPAPSALP